MRRCEMIASLQMQHGEGGILSYTHESSRLATGPSWYVTHFPRKFTDNASRNITGLMQADTDRHRAANPLQIYLVSRKFCLTSDSPLTGKTEAPPAFGPFKTCLGVPCAIDT